MLDNVHDIGVRFPDEIDAAAVTAEMGRESAIAAIRTLVRQPGSDVCIECDEPISPARRMAYPSAVRCTSCEDDHARASALYAPVRARLRF